VAETVSGRSRTPDLADLRVRYPHLYALIEVARNAATGGIP